jgi:hypothetical protein
MEENIPNKVDQLFNALQKFKSDPSKDVWNKIEEGLDEDERKVARFSFGWKQYAAAALLMLTGLGVLFKIYFHQEAIFNQESVLRSKAGNSSEKSPKSVSHDSDLVSKSNLHDNGREGDKGKLPAAAGDRTQRVAGNGARNTAMTDLIAQRSAAGKDLTLLNSNEQLMHTVSTQGVEAFLQVPLISQPALPVKDMTDKSLTVIHQKTRFKDRLSVTPFYSKEFAGYSLTDNDLTGVNGQEIEERERNVFSASVGFYLNYNINRRWVLQSGISYSWSKSNIDSGTSYAVVDGNGSIQYKLNTISGYGYLKPASATQPNVGDSVYTAKSYSQLHYLTIPLIVSYRIPLRRFSLLIGVGASFNLLTNAELQTKTYGNGDPEKKYSVKLMGLKKVNYGAMVKLDLEYQINSNLGVNIIPCFKNTLSPINLQSAITAYPYNFGIGAGITYRF